MFNPVALALMLRFSQDTFVRTMCFLQMPPQVHINGDGHAHYDKRTAAQNQKPPDHPHSGLG